ncbi:MAG: translation initiation factor IF-2 [Candidatus Diapherotrites archaeon]|jgi:translation initiation factor 5B|uniref:Translation initiation factor IF-2 n=1 Tax=Candidatus Iainarchaeum sp. TaxID=3101447 RepID=A0A8T5GF60_9ARCH|nr:translation initiation factor IF-2 [Candidatus Diapherotrites archaeon]
MIRQPIITVLGHVDHGKTSILDAIRESRVAAKEAGAITQHIGGTEIPLSAVENIAGNLIQKFGFDLKIPGLLVIDTPGHEAFSNLRKRGGSIADLAILVIDITQGLQPQTIEAIEILKNQKVPFVIALNKIDLLSFYDSKTGSFLANHATQSVESQQKLDEKLYVIVGKMYEHGFESERFDRCEFGKQIPMVPCSAHTKEGLPELLTLLSGLSQKYLEKELEISTEETAKAAVLEAKEEQGLGTTLDVILYKGKLHTNDEIIVMGKNGVITTKIRALLQPKPLQEMRDTKDKFSSVKEVFAAAGVKIAAPGLDEVMVGSTLSAVVTGEEASELEAEIKESTFENDERGVIVKADAIGSLEALVGMLKNEGINVRKADIGDINRKDVVQASSMLCEEPLFGCVLGFNVKIEKEAQHEANERDVRIFNEPVIYKLIENYQEWVTASKKAEKEEGMSCLIWPVELESLRGSVFRNSKPAIIGVRVNTGKVKEGWKVMNKAGEVIGKITGIQKNGETVKEGKKGDELAIAINDGIIGRNLFEGEKLYSCIPLKQYCNIEKYLEEFSEEEKELLQTIKEKQILKDGEEEL